MFKNLNKKLTLIILLSVFAGIVLAVVMNSGIKATSSNSFCLNCHDAPEFKANYDLTPHARLDCLDCHGQGFVKDKIGGIGHFFDTVSGKKDPNNYPNMKADVPDEMCLSCHNMNNVNRHPAVISGHEIYRNYDLTCIDCHDSVFMHGRLDDHSN
ncbi:hypothetical protein BKP35_05295 [Anaerobacillus arseniciselenatis]|uniref:Cytochrome c-type protein n=1 Tax=Anaerobacillus arseniciselenatis TaxID=85682 RepID=A0A1S2LSF4_9BACI|nr:NapC/NirT family cytochrome c [Anaerobacillus arseniciselenatis]OIJ15264.1 hypothetical protein BKP35_05295 [Anaerobacillus arseniciselenatis]